MDILKRVLVSTLFPLFALGCGFQLRDNVDHRPIRLGQPPLAYWVDSEASFVEYLGNNSPTSAEAQELHYLTADLLRARVPAPGPGAVPARFRAVYRIQRVVWPESWTPLCIDLQVIGCPTGKAEAFAQIELQVGNDMFVGSGMGSAFGGLYYYGFSGTPMALAESMQQAVANLQWVGQLRPFPVPAAPLPNAPGTPQAPAARPQ